MTDKIIDHGHAPYPSINSKGKFVMLPHDGTIPVNNPDEPRMVVYSVGGREQMRVKRRCVWCASPYFWSGDPSFVERAHYCPACMPKRNKYVQEVCRVKPR